jgi:vacuolar protein sorting-associated protein 26
MLSVHRGIIRTFTQSLRLSAELFYDRGNHYEFLSLTHQLASPGEVPAGGSGAAFDFEFKNVEKAYESYNGINVKLRYD